jgi:hypothetical protein
VLQIGVPEISAIFRHLLSKGFGVEQVQIGSDTRHPIDYEEAKVTKRLKETWR